ncbi:MAG TPA: hypothetical protein ENG40_03380 [Thermoprotei archaeon]|nr:hypothetical protein [Thermoprotei archaeon]
MLKCPECDGTLKYDSRLKQYICTNCGRIFTREELIKIKEEKIFKEKKKSKTEEYLNWWLSKKERR